MGVKTSGICVGNLVTTKKGGLYVVQSIARKNTNATACVQGRPYSTIGKLANKEYCEDINPKGIRITYEWLHAFGFVGDFVEGEVNSTHFTAHGLRLNILDINKIKTVHNLQNYYYIMTGINLVIKHKNLLPEI